MLPQTIEVIKQRHLEQSLPRKRNDPYKVGLCIEGGAMRTVVAIGESVVLELMGMKNCFDVVYGASGGAFTGSFFVANQSLYGAQIPLDYLNNDKFIDLKRHFFRKRVINLEYLLYDVMENNVYLDYPAFFSSDIPLKIVATDAIRAKSTVVPYGHTKEGLFNALHATAHIPGAHGHRPDVVDGKLLWDAAILDPFCIDIALSEGCTHLLFLLSLPLERNHQASLGDRYFLAPYIRKFNRKLADIYIDKYSADLEKLKHHLSFTDKTEVDVIAPGELDKIPGPLSKDRSLLSQGFMVGVERSLQALAVDDVLGRNIREHVISQLNLEFNKKYTAGYNATSLKI